MADFNPLKLSLNLISLVKQAEQLFPSDDLQTRKFEAEHIIAHVLKIKRVDIYTIQNFEITRDEFKTIHQMFDRRINNEPLQYITGYTQFRDLQIKVGPGVLIPRPETEQLIDIVLDVLRSPGNILDIGTGSGAIALSLAHEYPAADVTGVDISQDALKYAEINKKINQLKNVSFLYNDLCHGFPPESFDLIVSNPPYVTEEEYNNLTPDVRDFEPETALRSGIDGLNIIRTIIPLAFKTLKKNGYLILETGYMQGKKTAGLLAEHHFRNIEIKKDFANKDRFAIGQK